MVHVSETASRGTHGGVQARPPESPLDDWLGEISDDDWSEEATARAQDRGTAPSLEALPASEGDRRSRAAEPPTAGRSAAAADANAVVRRRRLVAGLVLAVVLGLAIVIPLLLLRGGDESPAPTVSAPTTATPAPDDTPTSTPTTPSTSTPSTTTPSTTTPSTTTPPTGATTAFTLPEGTKLQVGAENDAALVRALQQALTKAGYNPGPADGTFGAQTEAAVVAFQQDNGLSVDGRVGPETAAALDSALAGG